MNILLSGIIKVGYSGRRIWHFCRIPQKCQSLWNTFSDICKTSSAFKNPDITVSHMFNLGIESVPLISVIALFLGSETVIQSVYQMRGLHPCAILVFWYAKV